MRLAYEYFAAWRYLKAGKKKGFVSLITILSLAGVTVGVMTLVVVIAVMTGAEYDFKARVLGAQPHILLMRHGGLFSTYRPALATIESIAGITAARPFIHSQVVLRSAKCLAGAMLKGLEPTAFSRLATQAEIAGTSCPPPTDSAPDSPEAIPHILIGKALAEELKVKCGEQVLYLIFSQGNRFAIGRLPAMRRFVVAGIFSTGLDEYDKAVIYTPLAEAQKIINAGDAASGIEIELKEAEKAREIAQEIKLRIGPEFWTMDWMQMNHNIFSALRLQKAVMFIILILIVLVAAFNIAGSLFMMVMERSKDIAIFKAMGATNTSIRRIFIFKGMVIGGVGSLIGVLGGFIVCSILSQYQFIDLDPSVYYFNKLPIKLESLDVLLITASALLICFLASLYPSFLAARMTPVEGLRIG